MPYWLNTRALELTPLRSVQKVCATNFKGPFTGKDSKHIGLQFLQIYIYIYANLYMYHTHLYMCVYIYMCVEGLGLRGRLRVRAF